MLFRRRAGLVPLALSYNPSRHNDVFRQRDKAAAQRMELVIGDMQAAGRSQRQIVSALNGMSAKTANGSE